MDKQIIEPVTFVDDEEDIIAMFEDENKKEEEAKLKLKCKYGKLEVNLSKLPIIGDLF